MYTIKQVPEDFKVQEIIRLDSNETGKYGYFLLKKKNTSTLEALDKISKFVDIAIKNIGFAGNKDKRALTEQIISIKGGNKDIENIKLYNIELKFVGKGDKEIYLGRNYGNTFKVIVRNIDSKKLNKLKRINKKIISVPNYFGEQRFSNNNVLIGKAIVKKRFREAIDLILNSSSKYSSDIQKHLKIHKNDFVVALKIIPFRMLKLYVHSYQSFLFNKLLERYISKSGLNIDLPLIGFGTEIEDNELISFIEEIMKNEDLKFRDFIIYQIPELSSEGSLRKAYIGVNDFLVSKEEKDELNNGMFKVKLSFTLPKGCYATVFVDQIFKN